MRFVADENLPRAAVAALRAGGHDVLWIREDMPRASDEQIVMRSTEEGRILLTFDKDFGELAFRARLPVKCGIVLFRLQMPKTVEAGERIARLVMARSDWAGRFSVVAPGRLRMRDLLAP